MTLIVVLDPLSLPPQNMAGVPLVVTATKLIWLLHGNVCKNWPRERSSCVRSASPFMRQRATKKSPKDQRPGMQKGFIMKIAGEFSFNKGATYLARAFEEKL